MCNGERFGDFDVQRHKRLLVQVDDAPGGTVKFQSRPAERSFAGTDSPLRNPCHVNLRQAETRPRLPAGVALSVEATRVAT